MDRQTRELKDKERNRLLKDAEDKVNRWLNGTDEIPSEFGMLPAVPPTPELVQLVLMKVLLILHPHTGRGDIESAIGGELKRLMKD